MRKILLFALAIVCSVATVTSQNAAQQGKRYNVYGVMFYNLENLFDTINSNGTYDLEFSPHGARQWNTDKYYKKLHNLAYAISQMTTPATPYGPAVIGVSEVENITVLQDLVRQPELKPWHLQIVHHDSPDRRGIDVAVLYNPRYFTFTGDSTFQRLVVPGYASFRTRDQWCVSGKLAGENVSIIVNHWPSRLGGQERSSYLREAAAAMCRRTVDSLLAVDPRRGVIFMGDLNDDPMDVSCAKVLGGKRYVKDVTAPGDLYNPFWEKLAKGIGTLAYKGGWNLFDQIMMSQYFTQHYEGKDKPHLTFLRAEVLNREFLRNADGDYKGYPHRTFASGVFLNGYSDHFPTEIFLTKEVK